MAKEGANPTCSSSKWNGGGGSSIQPSGLATRVGTLAGERRSPASESGEEDDSEDSDCSSSMGQNSDVSGSGSSEEDCRETSFRARTRDLRMPWTRWSRVQIANKYLCENKEDLDLAVEKRIVESSCLAPWVLKVTEGHKSTPLAFSPNQSGKFIYQTQKMIAVL